MRGEPRDTPKLSASPDVHVDSRVHAGVCSDDPAYAKEVERRDAPMAAVRKPLRQGAVSTLLCKQPDHPSDQFRAARRAR